MTAVIVLLSVVTLLQAAGVVVAALLLREVLRFRVSDNGRLFSLLCDRIERDELDGRFL
jgi:hypothetical protein